MTKSESTKPPAARSLASAAGSALRVARSSDPRRTVAAPHDDPDGRPAADATELATGATPLEADADEVEADVETDAESDSESDPESDSDDTDDESDDAEAAARPRERVPGRARPTVVVTALVAVAALVFAVIAGVVWWRSGHGNASRDLAEARDVVARESRIDIAAVTMSDYRNADKTFAKWLSVSTGALHKEFAGTQASAVALLKQSQIIATATVIDAAVAALDIKGGTATVIASVNLKKQPANGAAATIRNRFKAGMTRVDGHWKLASLGIISVQLS